MKIYIKVKGSAKSGNWGHKGRPGYRGGSVPAGQAGLEEHADLLQKRDEARETRSYYIQFKKTVGIDISIQELMDTVANMMDTYPKQKELEDSVDSQMEEGSVAVSPSQRAIREVLEGLNPEYLLQDEPPDSTLSNYNHVKNVAIDNAAFYMESLYIPQTPITRKVFIDSFPSKQEVQGTVSDAWENNRYREYSRLSSSDKATFNTMIAERAYDVALGREYLDVGANFEAMDFIISGKLRQAYNWAWNNFGHQWDGRELPGFEHQFAKALAVLAKDGNLGWESSTLEY